ncbi:FAD-dependent oxidoreductase [Ideonella sp. 4Y11]|uniref:FAD-dependent oxidoreductase n=2 Tax=Ideonella TaxID=36862 RepID=A0A941BMS0_9BURK|nr:MULTISPECIES: FAD-dependent oxidoreductase [Ideonella]MBQ0933058.1 FAD-dependent oxidoreductase [Ideonella alba]MBQ0961154.1 FAD-dependent oxidoreductase [Ideonella aquatica]
MIDVLVVGGGVCGLALAQGLQARGLDWQLLEARPRLGGRVLTRLPSAGPALDLGPTWFWPASQPAITQVVRQLGLPTLPQPDDGWLQWLDDPAQGPRRQAMALGADGQPAPADQPQPGALHGGAQRLVDGMAALVTALAGLLPRERLHLGSTLLSLDDAADHVRATVMQGGQRHVWSARQVVLALPPRLVAQDIVCTPALPPPVSQALADTPTWMATAAKAALAAPTGRPAPWRQSGGCGNAWVPHAQAVLAEVFDAGVSGDGDALAGFIALPAAERPRFAASLALLLDSQVEQLWGAGAGDGEWHHHDWAQEPLTCSQRDLADEAHAGPAWSSEWLRQPLWEGRLLLGGSETARRHAGHLEGALQAAARLKQQVDTLWAAKGPAH